MKRSINVRQPFLSRIIARKVADSMARLASIYPRASTALVVVAVVVVVVVGAAASGRIKGIIKGELKKEMKQESRKN